jgi:hypothetical protein
LTVVSFNAQCCRVSLAIRIHELYLAAALRYCTMSAQQRQVKTTIAIHSSWHSNIGASDMCQIANRRLYNRPAVSGRHTQAMTLATLPLLEKPRCRSTNPNTKIWVGRGKPHTKTFENARVPPERHTIWCAPRLNTKPAIG